MGALKTLRAAFVAIYREGTPCGYCQKPTQGSNPNAPDFATLDHLIPRSRGGTNVVTNVTLACQRCNVDKGDMTEEEYRAFLEGRASSIRHHWSDVRRAGRRHRRATTGQDKLEPYVGILRNPLQL